jgi:dimethylglycine catabolism A
MRHEKLFSEITVGGISFPNRIMRTSMVSGLTTEDGRVTEALKERYRREARGGVGSIVVEAAVVLPSRSSFNLRLSDDSFTQGLKELVDTIRDANPEPKLGIQIMHFLKLSRSGWRQKVADFKPEDFSLIVEQHADGARRAVSAGFDFIELHMAHAYTLSSFLSSSNTRQDAYGRTLRNRMRLPTAVYERVRDEVGKDYPIGVRINAEDFTVPGTTLLHSVKIAKKLAGLGAAYLSLSAGSRFEDALPPAENKPHDPMSGYSGQRMSPPWWFPDAPHLYLAEGVKKALNAAGYRAPVVTAGKIHTPKLAEEILRQGQADMIGLCRPLLCDPDWPIKAKEDRANEIVPCTSCNWCLEADSRMEKVSCSRWPEGALVAPTPFNNKEARPSELPKEAGAS